MDDAKWRLYIEALAKGASREVALSGAGMTESDRTSAVFMAPGAEAAANYKEEQAAMASARREMAATAVDMPAPDLGALRSEARRAARRVLQLDTAAIEDASLPWAERSKAKDRIVAIAQLVGAQPPGHAITVPIQIVVRTEGGGERRVMAASGGRTEAAPADVRVVEG